MGKPKRTDIPIGEDKAISRQALVMKWGLPDRAVRKQIEEFRKDPDSSDCIISHSDGRDYWRSTDIDEIEAYRAELESYRKAFDIRIQVVDRVLVNLRAEEAQSFLNF